jgi:DtxR family Mn-dependent transcriptional regulator
VAGDVRHFIVLPHLVLLGQPYKYLECEPWVMSISHSESMEMYLKTVAEIGGIREPVPIGRVAERMEVTSVSANEMMKRLAAQGLIEHLPYKGVKLTRAGCRLANNVIRRQRLWECFLVDKLGMNWAQSHELACDLEHATAAAVAEALANYLGQPGRCPHGNPIPIADSETDVDLGVSLDSFQVGQMGRIVAIRPEREEVLAYLHERGLLPGQQVTVIESAPLQGPLTLDLGNRQVVLGLNLATLILMEGEAVGS